MVADHLRVPYQDLPIPATTRLQLLEAELRAQEEFSASMENVIQEYDKAIQWLS